MRAIRLLAAVAVLAAGVCAAWPFRQPLTPPPRPPPSAGTLDLRPRGQDAPLPAGPPGEPSPASGLYDMSQAAPLIRPISATIARPDLAELAPPPAMPREFALASEQHLLPPATLAPRTYRLRDGDTLAWIAERFLGSPNRADELFAANRDVLARPDLLPVGVTILLPAREPQP